MAYAPSTHEIDAAWLEGRPIPHPEVVFSAAAQEEELVVDDRKPFVGSDDYLIRHGVVKADMHSIDRSRVAGRFVEVGSGREH